MQACLLLFLLFSFGPAAYCPAERVTACENVGFSFASGCSTVYQFNPSPTTSMYPNVPKVCTAGSRGFDGMYSCQATTTTCEPPCTLTPGWKTGGPNGKICTGFFTQSDCNSYYADNGGDKWCFWSGTQCFQGITCHD